MNKKGKAVLAAVIMLLMLGSIAATVDSPPPYCIVVLEPVKAGEKNSEVVDVICLDTPPAVDPFALSFDGKEGNETDGVVFGRDTYYALGRDWDYFDFGGSIISWVTTNPDMCNEGDAYIANTMPSGWNDRVSSAQLAGGSGCRWYYHYEHTYRGGSSYNCGTSCAWMPSWINNETSSEYIR